jgi:tetratricopeptide (TPR) repeat protein
LSEASQSDSPAEKAGAASALKGAQQLMRDGQLSDALAALRQVLVTQPQDSEANYLAAVCHRFLKQQDAAREILEALLAREPENGRALQEYAHLARDRGDTETALRYYEQALRANPALLASYQHRVALLRQMGRNAEAEATAAQERRARSLPPALLAVTDLLAQGRIVKAESLCRRFLLQTPHHPEAMRLLAEIGVRLGALDEAHFLLESACELRPDDPALRIDLIRVLSKRQRFAESLEQAERLLAVAPDNLQYQSLRAIELLQLGRYEESIAAFDAILEHLPDDPGTLTSRGHALKTCGRSDDAIASYRRAATERNHGEAWYALANLKTYRFDDRELDRMRAQLGATDQNTMDRVYLAFALGKASEDREDYAEAFAQFARGNAMKRSQLRYRSEVFHQEVDAQIRELSADILSAQAGAGCDAPDPIFIVGMPRAGSTLLEQILAAHSAIDGTRELPNILSLAQRLRRRSVGNGDAPGYPAILRQLDTTMLRQMGSDYIEQTRIHRGDAPFFIDKMPNNFRHIGLIHLILPRAKIIDARREPMACCFSNFQQLFAEGQEFSYDLDDVGRYYRDYLRLMEHWDTVLPGRVHRLQHETLLDDFEGELRRMLDYLELPFEENCLRYYESDRAVRTPSSEQVRQPLYRDAVDKWQNYTPWLQPLRDALGNCV